MVCWYGEGWVTDVRLDPYSLIVLHMHVWRDELVRYKIDGCGGEGVVKRSLGQSIEFSRCTGRS